VRRSGSSSPNDSYAKGTRGDAMTDVIACCVARAGLPVRATPTHRFRAAQRFSGRATLEARFAGSISYFCRLQRTSLLFVGEGEVRINTSPSMRKR
jgi:hypothetical protein